MLFTGFNEATAQNDSLIQDETLLSQVLKEQKVSDEKLMSINFTNVSLVKALEILADRLKVGFSYNPDVIPDKTVSFEMKNVQAHEIIYKLLEGTNLEPILPPSKDVIILRKKESKIEINNIQDTIAGKVVDSDGETLPGVTVLLENNPNIGTATDVNGEFELTVPSLEGTLIFSSIGYQTQEVSIDGRTEIDVTLRAGSCYG